MVLLQNPKHSKFLLDGETTDDRLLNMANLFDLDGGPYSCLEFKKGSLSVF